MSKGVVATSIVTVIRSLHKGGGGPPDCADESSIKDKGGINEEKRLCT